jgi:gliding motility-associated-like protein
MGNATLQKLLGLLIIANIAIVNLAKAQTPANCLEIESILVDACGTPEGENEMVRFKIGPSPINVSNLNVSWPNNNFLGISPVNSTTNNIVNTLNATILSCGYLVQPTGGILPAGKTVLLITSTNVSTSANSFANLTDTLYVIFQNAGNTAGHFANYSTPSGLRYLTIATISPACSDGVFYDKVLLVNQSGGSGGTSAQNDGATVQYDWAGNATYINNGCQAPISILTSDAGANTSICQSGTAALTGTASGNYTGVIWQGGQGSFSSPSTLNTNYTASPSESGSITLSLGVIGHCHDTVFSTVTITVNSAPTASISASGSTTFCQGSSVTLTASGGNSYSWSTGSSSSSITANSAGTYTVTVSNNCGSQTATQVITVNPLPTASISANGPTTICSGSSVTLNASGIGSYLWSTGETTNSITVSTAGTYTLTSTNGCGSQQATQTVTIDPLPTATISSSGNTTFCQGNSVILTASGGDTYSWNTGSTSSSITVNAAGTYTVTSSNSCGSQTATETITVNPLPIAVISAGGPTTICSGSSVTLSASGSGNYSWSTGETTNSIIVSAAGTYTLTSTNSCGSQQTTETINVNPLPTAVISPSGPTTLCTGGSVTLTASGGNTYSWNTGATSSSINVSTAGTYTVTSSNSCGSQTATEVITVITAPSVTIHSLSNSFCSGSTLLLYATGTGNYLWSNGLSNDSIQVSTGGNYTVSSASSCGTATDNITVSEIPLPVASITASGTTDLCPGSSVILTGFGGTSYTWLPSGTSGNSFTTSIAGTYTLSASNSCGSNTSTVTVNSINFPIASITPSGSVSICAGNYVTLNASGGQNYLWSNGQTSNSISVGTEGVFSVVASNACGSDASSISVTVNSVEAAFTPSVLSGTSPLTVDFTNNSSTSATNFLWDLGDNSSSTAVSPSNIYVNSGTYSVTLTATNALGCSDSYSVTINVVDESSSLQMPNVFTPNNDRKNDEFKAIGVGIDEFNCVIYDRWGTQIAEIKSFNDGWNGTTSNGAASDGTYYYLVKAKGRDGKIYEPNGFFQLMSH